MNAKKKAPDIDITMFSRKTFNIDMELGYWDQLVKVAAAIIARKALIPSHADVKFTDGLGGPRIAVSWEIADDLN